MTLSPARQMANRKYNEKAYDRVELKVKKGRKADIQAHAAGRGESLNVFINRAIDEALAREDTKRLSAYQIKRKSILQMKKECLALGYIVRSQATIGRYTVTKEGTAMEDMTMDDVIMFINAAIERDGEGSGS